MNGTGPGYFKLLQIVTDKLREISNCVKSFHQNIIFAQKDNSIEYKAKCCSINKVHFLSINHALINIKTSYTVIEYLHLDCTS